MDINMFRRIDDVRYEHQRVLLPIEGYENARLMSLEEAVKPITYLFDERSLTSKIWVIKERCKKSFEGLSQDESASIVLYTIEWPTREQSLYFILNRTLRMEDRNLLKPWFPYLRLFIGGLSQLPPVNDIVFRGVKKDMTIDYSNKDKLIWWGFSSCTDNMSPLESEQFCGNRGDRTIFRIKCFEGRNIQKHSYFYGENEILLLPGRYLKLNRTENQGNGLHIVELEEIKPPHDLIKLPDNSPWRRFNPGLSLLGICMNTECQAYRKEVIMPTGFGTFDVLTDVNINTSKCPQCKDYVDPSKLGFNECQWRLSGIRQKTPEAPLPFSENWSPTHGYSLSEYNLQQGFNWRKLIVQTKPENAT